MIGHIWQHIPNFADGVEPADGAFGSLDELLAIPFVVRWAETPGFVRFSLTDQHHLMAEMSDGKYWVVGRLTDPPALDLPVWVAPSDRS